ncbi:MAG: hypothetical protein ACH349_07490, partial [Candidatus Rhabdochlamydia sp.]
MSKILIAQSKASLKQWHDGHVRGLGKHQSQMAVVMSDLTDPLNKGVCMLVKFEASPKNTADGESAADKCTTSFSIEPSVFWDGREPSSVITVNPQYYTTNIDIFNIAGISLKFLHENTCQVNHEALAALSQCGGDSNDIPAICATEGFITADYNADKCSALVG